MQSWIERRFAAASIRHLVVGAAVLGAVAVTSCKARPPAPSLPAAGSQTLASSPALAAPSSSASPAPPVEAVLPDAAAALSRVRRPPAPPRAGWPLSRSCDRRRCTTALGDPGFRCGSGGACFNPCPTGLAPDAQGFFCERRCRADAECDEGRCTGGLCDSMGAPPCGGPPGIGGCSMPDGRAGFLCADPGPCYPWCKAGLDLWGGTHCVKSCRSPADCPGGECAEKTPEGEGICAPICPSEGCPYPWE